MALSEIRDKLQRDGYECTSPYSHLSLILPINDKYEFVIIVRHECYAESGISCSGCSMLSPCWSYAEIIKNYKDKYIQFNELE
jgi:hypothetical protein